MLNKLSLFVSLLLGLVGLFILVFTTPETASLAVSKAELLFALILGGVALAGLWYTDTLLARHHAE